MRKLLCLLLILPLFVCSVFAEENPTEEILAEVLSQTDMESSLGYDFSGTAQKALTGELEFSFPALLSELFTLLFAELRSHFYLLVEILVLAVLCNLQVAKSGDGIGEISFLACFSVIAGLSVNIIASLAELAETTIDSLRVFMASLMPALAGLVSQAKLSAFAGFYPALFVSMQGFTAICRQFFLPLILMITALSVVNAMSNRFHITRLIEVTRQVIKWGLGLLLTIFVGILSIRGFSVFAAGSIAGRTVKYALCNFVPLVGSVLAESAEAVISSVRLIRGAVGIAGTVGLVTLCALPLFKILAVSILYRFAAGIAEPATDKRIILLLMDLAGNITLIFAILLMVTVMFIISIALICGLCV